MEKEFSYHPHGTCSSLMTFKVDTDNDTILDFTVKGGCPGNLAGIRKLIIGMNINDVIDKLQGVTCGFKPTSCPDQLAKALKEYLAQKN